MRLTRLGRSSRSTPKGVGSSNSWARVLASTLLLAAVSCSDGQSETAADPWPSVWRVEVVHQNYEQAFRELPIIRGTASNRLYWRGIAEGEEGDELEAVHAVRRFLTVQYAVTRNSPMHRNAYLYQFVATERMLHEMYPDGPLHPDHGPWHEGPVWIWLLYIEPAGEAAYQVGVCADIGWWERDTHLEHLPRADRALLREFRVVREVDDAGADRWKIDQEYSDADTRLDERWGEPCREWAVHTTEEPRE